MLLALNNGATHGMRVAALDGVMMAVYAYGGRHAFRRFSARTLQWINRSCAGMLAALAVGLSLYRRSDMH